MLPRPQAGLSYASSWLPFVIGRIAIVLCQLLGYCSLHTRTSLRPNTPVWRPRLVCWVSRRHPSMLCRGRSRAPRCSSPRARSQPSVPLRTLATRRATTDTHRHGEQHSDAEQDAGHSNDIDTDTDAAAGWPHPIHASARTEAKKSIFVAHASRLPSASPTLLRAFLDHLTAQPALKRATHCMYAWRVVPPPGLGTSSNQNTTTITSASTNTVFSGQNDGGEKGAGERLARLLEATGCANVVVVVSRWYGGVHLGSERWRMISGVAKDALARGAFGADKNGPVNSGSSTSTSQAANAKISSNKKKRKK